MDLRSILLAFLSFAVPFFYSWFTGNFPDFPLAQSDTLALIVWGVGLVIGGWNANKVRVAFRLGKSYRQIVSVLVLLTIFCLPQMARAQQAQLDTTKWGIGIGLEMGQFWLNGDYTILKSPLAIGVNYKGIDDDLVVGAFVAPTVAVQNDSAASSISGLGKLTLFNTISIGGGIRFWEEGRGIVALSRDRWFLSIGVGLAEIISF